MMIIVINNDNALSYNTTIRYIFNTTIIDIIIILITIIIIIIMIIIKY